mmetsp:Transcript_133199/g.414162  ORF Transcript_133199/g.414162 Transcript_133199/m.414162 type:complete len:218 (+) Transcript_133199:947-1600(+)
MVPALAHHPQIHLPLAPPSGVVEAVDLVRLLADERVAPEVGVAPEHQDQDDLEDLGGAGPGRAQRLPQAARVLAAVERGQGGARRVQEGQVDVGEAGRQLGLPLRLEALDEDLAELRERRGHVDVGVLRRVRVAVVPLVAGDAGVRKADHQTRQPGDHVLEGLVLLVVRRQGLVAATVPDVEGVERQGRVQETRRAELKPAFVQHAGDRSMCGEDAD